jgi:hypothetical protein
MPEDKNDFQKRLEEIDRQLQDQELAKIYKLSQKNMVIAAILSFIFPIGGYIYTARWKAFWILFSILFGIVLIGTINEKDDEKVERFATFCGLVASIVAPIDNIKAIQAARDKINEMN